MRPLLLVGRLAASDGALELGVTGRRWPAGHEAGLRVPGSPTGKALVLSVTREITRFVIADHICNGWSSSESGEWYTRDLQWPDPSKVHHIVSRVSSSSGVGQQT